MNVMDTIIPTIAIGLTLGLLLRYQNWKRQQEEKAKLAQQVNLAGIRTFQEEIGKMETRTVKDTESYKQAKDLYDKKYRSRIRPSSDDGSGPKGAS